MRSVLIGCLLFPLFVLSQSARFTQIKVKPLKKYYDVDSATIFFPVVVLSNQAVAAKINTSLRNRIVDTRGGDSTFGLNSSILLAVENGLVDLTYDILFNNNGMLSLDIRGEGTVAHPYYFQETLNFDLASGNAIAVSDLFTPAGLKSFKTRVKHDKTKALVQHKSELKTLLSNKEITKEVYDTALETINECLNSLSLDKFTLDGSSIVIYDNCEFPHYIRSIGPGYTLQYKLASLKIWLKSEKVKQLF
jgi:hypothetical protein